MNTMMIQLPESSMLSSLGYNPREQVLTALFKNGGTYAYSNVPWEAMQEIAESPSVGKAFHKRIKANSHLYPFRRV